MEARSWYVVSCAIRVPSNVFRKSARIGVIFFFLLQCKWQFCDADDCSSAIFFFFWLRVRSFLDHSVATYRRDGDVCERDTLVAPMKIVSGLVSVLRSVSTYCRKKVRKLFHYDCGSDGGCNSVSYRCKSSSTAWCNYGGYNYYSSFSTFRTPRWLISIPRDVVVAFASFEKRWKIARFHSEANVTARLRKYWFENLQRRRRW